MLRALSPLRQVLSRSTDEETEAQRGEGFPEVPAKPEPNPALPGSEASTLQGRSHMRRLVSHWSHGPATWNSGLRKRHVSWAVRTSHTQGGSAGPSAGLLAHACRVRELTPPRASLPITSSSPQPGPVTVCSPERPGNIRQPASHPPMPPFLQTELSGSLRLCEAPSHGPFSPDPSLATSHSQCAPGLSVGLICRTIGGALAPPLMVALCSLVQPGLGPLSQQPCPMAGVIPPGMSQPEGLVGRRRDMR